MSQHARPESVIRNAEATLIFRENLAIVFADRVAEELFARPSIAMVGRHLSSVLEQDSALELYKKVVADPILRAPVPRVFEPFDLTGVLVGGYRFPVRAIVEESDFLGHRIFMAAVRPVGRRRQDARLQLVPPHDLLEAETLDE